MMLLYILQIEVESVVLVRSHPEPTISESWNDKRLSEV